MIIPPYIDREQRVGNVLSKGTGGGLASQGQWAEVEGPAERFNLPSDTYQPVIVWYMEPSAVDCFVITISSSKPPRQSAAERSLPLRKRGNPF